MIVYVTTQDQNKQKSQFKLRGSAFDKIKADFGGKNEAYVKKGLRRVSSIPLIR